MTEFQFPEFVADQLLTAEDLNNMFGYLEEQERLTRTTMIGIGIICGLDAKTSADGTSITITRGGGDTSEGYLMRLETDTFYEYKAFDALKPKYYDVFVNSTVEASGDIKRTQKFPIWELFSKSETDAQPLSKTFLQDKVVLLFYEMLEVDAKNCDPTSCDDKGRDVLITIRKLLITKEAAEQLLPKEDKASGSGLTTEELLAEKLKLPELRIRRFDVGATNLVDTNHIYEAYQRIFSKNMVIGVDNALYQMHKLYKYLVKDVVSGNPFNNFSDKFAFLHNGSISGNNLLHFQYFYGFFYDLLQAYEELRCLGLKITAQCCPDPNLFPRHLLLGEAIPDAGQERLRYRNYFIPSPILNNQADMVAYFKVLYKRLVLMINNVQMPVPAASVKNGVDTNIRVTPSKLGCYPLADKAIPYYYKPNEENGRLYLYWGYKWHCKMKPRHVLSYNATKYNTEDDFVINPLSYDIEPYNFYRIEGHVGKNYKAALSAITATRNNARLPFDVVAVSASLNEGEIDLKKMYCHFHDLEALYDSLRAQLVCALCKLAVYYYGFATTVETLEIISNKPNLPLLKACAPDFTFQIRTLGHEFEILYPVIKNVNDINIGFYLNPNYINQILNFDNNLLRKFILFFMQKLFEQLPEDLSDFSLADFKFYHDRLVTVMKAMRVYLLGRLVQADGRAQEVILEDEIDHLDALLHVCTSRSLEALQAEYAERLTRVRGLTQLSKFVEKHPGIEHKGGVPKGGTFVLVYFEKEKQKPQ
ncbi:MAG TPA: hypothetical protein VD996_06105, partial [Chitinophagaceae bacterium]|nr:hypothetical protein [Chitinophagaceae bacterium]